MVARLEGGVEVRRYGPRLAAETAVEGEDDWQARGAAFRRWRGTFSAGTGAGPRSR